VTLNLTAREFVGFERAFARQLTALAEPLLAEVGVIARVGED
jgi:hypothetical protein